MTTLNIIVQNHGTRIGLCNGMLSIASGEQEHKIPLNKINSLQLTRSCVISSDAMLQAMEQGVDVIFVSRKGDPLGRLWNSRFGSISIIRKNQLAFSESKAAVDWMRKLLVMKHVLDEFVERRKTFQLQGYCFYTKNGELVKDMELSNDIQLKFVKVPITEADNQYDEEDDDDL